jgi:biopolymer transport protein ExbB
MKQSFFIVIVLIAALTISFVIYSYFLPDYIKKGGPLVVLLITLSIMVITFTFERLFSLNKAKGKGPLSVFLKKVRDEAFKGNLDGAIAACDKQRGSAATVLRAGLEQYKIIKQENKITDRKEIIADVDSAIQSSMMLEVPLLEKNLIALSTIATISVLVGLLGTVFGMIRSFKALATAGAPDAIALSLGISEALINTAGGLIGAIMGIVAYNYFFTRIDNFTYMIDDASLYMVKTLAFEQSEKK